MGALSGYIAGFHCHNIHIHITRKNVLKCLYWMNETRLNSFRKGQRIHRDGVKKLIKWEKS